jgi:hypothetical protein
MCAGSVGGTHPSHNKTHPHPAISQPATQDPSPPLLLREGWVPLRYCTGSEDYSGELSGGTLFFGQAGN